jgi:hypothetical protein
MAVVACNKFGPGDLSRVIAIELIAPDSLEEYDTLTPRARVLDGQGDSVAATVVWAAGDTAPILIVLDSLTGRTIANRLGQTGLLVALSRSYGITSNAVAIRTVAAADTLFATGVTVDTVALSADSVSDSLTVEVADTINALTVPLPGRPVVYSITYPVTSGPVTLVTNDSTHVLATSDTVTTSSGGIAFVKVRLLGSPVPDSVVVTAIARRAVGDTVPGSPVTFVVRFQP